jgi:succinate dehydrogenase / fumarate reductase, cytochrome b subunit
MSWITHFLTSSIGRKFIMSLTGIFLILFLIIHLIGNLQLLADDGGKQFNLYAFFMTTNPLIKTTSYLLYFFILLHAVQGWLIMKANKNAKGAKNYEVKVTNSKSTSSFSSTNMGWLGTIIFAFLLLHLYQFWLQMKLGTLPLVVYDGVVIKDLYTPVAIAYANPVYVIIYVVAMIVIGIHLYHGFQSAFQTLGLNHKKYTPFIKGLGKIYSLIVPLGFALIPLIMYAKISGLF